MTVKIAYLASVQVPEGAQFALPKGACWRHIERRFDTLVSAERSARALHRRYRTTVDIDIERSYPVDPDHYGMMSGRTQCETIAHVTSDAFGRVWTDAMIYGSTLI